MTGQRVAHTLDVGAHVEERDGTVWMKRGDEVFPWFDIHGSRCTDASIDQMISRGKAEPVVYEVDLDVDVVPANQVRAGEYVILTCRFYMAGGLLFEEGMSQQLWRVAGWTWHGPVTSTVLLDAPRDRLRATRYLEDPEGGWACEPFELYVDRDDMLHVVLPGQEHETWDDEFDWSEEYTLVGPRSSW